MISFDINGAIVDFDERLDNYNRIRRVFKEIARDSQGNFEDYCLNNIQNIKQISDKCLNIGENLIEQALKKSIETIVSYGVLTIDIEIFKEIYAMKYLNFQRLFNNLNKEMLLPNKNKRNNMKILDIKRIIQKISQYIYEDCFNIHFAVVDALLENNVDNVEKYLDEEDIKKSNALYNNYKDGFITKLDECKVVEQIIKLNPYKRELYEFLIKEEGDFSREIERFTDYIGYDLRGYKEGLMDSYIKQLMDNNIGDIESEKEKVKKYAKYIGCEDSSLFITRLDAIYTFENA
ncbi:kinase [Romboutsia weinsteinii]|uniref:Kinase n=1 Tax=Romboutsia weinsteinii TaxID=2020949 RepID=A0A371IZK9_9FIRM|nr:kinase [Romboutsia weinsteinii]RDY25884.1 kinase [Romboutsia weinsteinii]